MNGIQLVGGEPVNQPKWRRITCLAFHEAGIAAGECCSSCHADADDGYSDLGESYPPRGSGGESQVFASTCCGVTREGQPFTRDEFAAALRAYRRWLRSDL